MLLFPLASSRRQTPTWTELEAKRHYIKKRERKDERERQERKIIFHIQKALGLLLEIIMHTAL